MTETKVMLNINDPKLNEIAEVLGNKTAKKILGFLSKEESSVSKTAEALGLKLNVVDYNIKKLKKVGLIEEKKHFWSDRGKRMPAYGVVNKEIVISPRSSFFRSNILPAGVVSLLGAGLIYLSGRGKQLMETRVYDQAPLLAKESAASVGENLADAGMLMLSSGEPLWAWFLFGAVVALTMVLIIQKMKGGFKK